MPVLQVRNCMYNESGLDWRDWSWVFSTDKDKDKASSSSTTKCTTAGPIEIELDPLDPSNPDVIKGVVKILKKDRSYGLALELKGLVDFGSASSSFLETYGRGDTLHVYKIHSLLCGSDEDMLKENLNISESRPRVTTPSGTKYPFTLKLPQDGLPPSSPHVSYSFLVYRRSRYNYIPYGEMWGVQYRGQLPLIQNPVLEVVSKDLFASALDSSQSQKIRLKATLFTVKKDYLLDDEIPYTFILNREDATKVDKEEIKPLIIPPNTVQMVEIALIRKYGDGKNFDSESIESKKYRKFDNPRREYSATGFYTRGVAQIPSYLGTRSLSIRYQISYAIQITITTTTRIHGKEEANATTTTTLGSRTASEQIEIVLYTHEGQPGATAPPKDDIYNDDPTATSTGRRTSTPEIVDTPTASAPPPPHPYGAMSLAASTLSLFPPSYSQLPSRAMSLLSLETQPPSYDELEQGQDFREGVEVDVDTDEVKSVDCN